MEKVTIKILKSTGPFHDTKSGGKYEAFIYEAGEVVPAPWSRPWDNGPEESKVIALIDDAGDDILQEYEGTEGYHFTVVK